MKSKVPPTKILCFECKFWDGAENATRGRCHKYAPTPVKDLAYHREVVTHPYTERAGWCDDAEKK